MLKWILARNDGEHFHTRLDCPKVQENTEDDPYFLLTMEEVRQRSMGDYEPCACAIKDGYNSQISPEG